MIRLFTVLATILVLGFPVAAQAQIVGGLDVSDPGEGHDPVLPLPDLIEGWNDSESHCPAGAYGSLCWDWMYTPSVDYVLEQIQFFAGGVAGQVTMSLVSDDGSNQPSSGDVLATVTYNESATHDWQGADFDSPVAVTQGTLYWVQYQVVVGSDAATACAGTINPYWHGPDGCFDFNGPWESFPWMVRFYGTIGGTPTEETTWSTIKSLYH